MEPESEIGGGADIVHAFRLIKFLFVIHQLDSFLMLSLFKLLIPFPFNKSTDIWLIFLDHPMLAMYIDGEELRKRLAHTSIKLNLIYEPI